jgi:hypothetical protein
VGITDNRDDLREAMLVSDSEPSSGEGTSAALQDKESILGLYLELPTPPQTAAGTTHTEAQAWHGSSSSSHDGNTGSSTRAAGGGESGEELLVSPLSSEQLLQLGGLQPVSHRMLLMQLLSALKLPLMMMGRTEDALATIR